MNVKRAVDANKGEASFAQEHMNVIVSLIISFLIIISVWWFIAHNQYERVATQSAYNVYDAIGGHSVCSDGVKRTVPVYLPQELGFKGWMFQAFKLPMGNLGTDPYFYFYYEDFPPEGICTDPITGIVCYWKEDLPWSNNLILTGVVDGIAGLPLGNKYTQKIGEAIRKGTFKIFGAGEKALVKLTGGFYKGIKTALRSGIDSATDRIASSSAKTLKLAEVERDLVESISADEFRENLLKEGIIEQAGQKLTVKQEYRDALEQILKENPNYKFPLLEIEKTEAGVIKNAFYDLNGHISFYKEKVKNYFMNLNKLGYEKSLTATGSEEFIKKINALNSGRKAELFDSMGFKPSIMERLKDTMSEQKLIEYKAGKIDEMIKGLENEINHGGVIFIPKDSALIKYFDDFGDAAFDHYLQDLSTIKGEGGLLKGLFERKVLLVPEKYEPLKYQATYAILRLQDIFTPAGATYVDRYFSLSKDVICEPGDLCLKIGSVYIDKRSLEESTCFEKGVTEIKLKRGSTVASDPRFYLVSPCFAMLEITKEGNTIYIEPKICKNKPKGYENLNNYCFATKDMVNFYVSDEAASLIVGFIPGYGQALQFGLDVFREAIITYPYAYELPIVGDKLLGDSVWEGQC